jgi:ABC-type nitrate/sulfonate/bicarbonate transport system permease component
MREKNRASELRFGKSPTVLGVALGIAAFVTICSVWWEFGVSNEYSFSSPSRIIRVLFSGYGKIVAAVLEGGKYVGFGLGVGIFIGVGTGITGALFNRIAALTLFLVSAAIVFPLYSVFLIVIGYYGVLNDTNVYFITTYSVAAYLAYNTFRSVRGVIERRPLPECHDAAVMLFPGRFGMLRHYVVPLVLDEIFTHIAYISLRVWPLMIVFEPMGSPSTNGIGNYVYDAFQSGWWDHLFAGSIVIAVLGKLTQLVVLRVRSLVLRAY